MHVILGASGNVGFSVATRLLEDGERVRVITHDPAKKTEWEARGAEVAIADAHDENSLREAFRGGTNLFLLNPPAPPAADTVREERHSVQTILSALRGSSFTRIVAESTYGAQAGENLGDLGVLFEMEEGLRALRVPLTVIRAAYYMSNWNQALESARENGTVASLYPEDFKLPMVAPQDIGAFAARLLREPAIGPGVHFVEGPCEYSPRDVAEALAVELRRSVRVVVVPPSEWEPALVKLGFSKPAAAAMAAMTKVTLSNNYEKSTNPDRGSTDLSAYLRDLSRHGPIGLGSGARAERVERAS